MKETKDSTHFQLGTPFASLFFDTDCTFKCDGFRSAKRTIQPNTQRIVRVDNVIPKQTTY